MSKSLDLKYRPSKIRNYVGNQAVRDLLKTKLKKGNLPQVILLYGPHGTGKTTMARILGNEISCNTKVTTETKIKIEETRYSKEKEMFELKEILGDKSKNKDFFLESYHKRNIEPIDEQLEKLQMEVEMATDESSKEFKMKTSIPRAQQQKENLLNKEDEEKIKEEIQSTENKLKSLEKELENLEENEEGMACGNCEICKAFKNEFIAKGKPLPAVKEYNLASDTGKDFAEARIVEAKQPIPAPYTKKVYIYDEVHKMSQAAQNAFLKFAEEPPPNVYIIFCTTERDKIIDTLQSRMSRHRITRPSVSQLTNHLQFIADEENIEYEKSALRLIAKASNLIIRDAIKNLEKLSEYIITPDLVQEKLGVTTAKDHFNFFKASGDGVPELLTYLDKLSQEGRDLYTFYKELSNFLYDIVDIQYRGSQAEVFSPNFKKEIRKTFKNYTKSDFLNMVQIFSELRNKGESIKASIKFELLVLGLSLMGQMDPMEEEEREKLIREDKENSIKNEVSKERVDFKESIDNFKKGDKKKNAKDVDVQEVSVESSEIMSDIIRKINGR